MSNPFQEHAQNTADYLAMLQGDDGSGGATLTVLGVEFPCTFDSIRDSWILSNGKSSELTVPECKFLKSAAPANVSNTDPARRLVYERGLKCQLKVNPQAEPLKLKLWEGGLEQGGLIYRFTLVSENFHIGG